MAIPLAAIGIGLEVLGGLSQKQGGQGAQGAKKGGGESQQQPQQSKVTGITHQGGDTDIASDKYTPSE